MLVHRTGWWSHATVSTLSHAHSLHLTVTLIFRNAFLMHAIHWLVQLVHAVLWVA